MGHKWLFVNCNFDEFICWFSCSYLCDQFGYVNFVINFLIMLKLQDEYVFKSLFWTFGLKWWKVMLLLLIIDELMNLCLDCCWVMLLILIHALGIANYVVIMLMLYCWVFGDLGENDKLSWIMVLMIFNTLNELNVMN